MGFFVTMITLKKSIPPLLLKLLTLVFIIECFFQVEALLNKKQLANNTNKQVISSDGAKVFAIGGSIFGNAIQSFKQEFNSLAPDRKMIFLPFLYSNVDSAQVLERLKSIPIQKEKSYLLLQIGHEENTDFKAFYKPLLKKQKTYIQFYSFLYLESFYKQLMVKTIKRQESDLDKVTRKILKLEQLAIETQNFDYIVLNGQIFQHVVSKPLRIKLAKRLNRLKYNEKIITDTIESYVHDSTHHMVLQAIITTLEQYMHFPELQKSVMAHPDFLAHNSISKKLALKHLENINEVAKEVEKMKGTQSGCDLNFFRTSLLAKIDLLAMCRLYSEITKNNKSLKGISSSWYPYFQRYKRLWNKITPSQRISLNKNLFFNFIDSYSLEQIESLIFEKQKQIIIAQDKIAIETLRASFPAIINLSKKRNIEVILLQYPGLDSDILIKMAKEFSIAIIDNDPLFLKRIKEKDWNHFFSDKLYSSLGGNIGHIKPVAAHQWAKYTVTEFYKLLDLVKENKK